jgi:hypothetical protein
MPREELRLLTEPEMVFLVKLSSTYKKKCEVRIKDVSSRTCRLYFERAKAVWANILRDDKSDIKNWEIVCDEQKEVMTTLGIRDKLLLWDFLRKNPGAPAALNNLVFGPSSSAVPSCDASIDRQQPSSANEPYDTATQQNNDEVNSSLPLPARAEAQCQDQVSPLVDGPSADAYSKDNDAETEDSQTTAAAASFLCETEGEVARHEFQPPGSDGHVVRSSTPVPPLRDVEFLDGFPASEVVSKDVNEIMRHWKVGSTHATKNECDKLLQMLGVVHPELKKSTAALLKQRGVNELKASIKRKRIYGIPTYKSTGKKFVSVAKCPPNWQDRPKKFLGEFVYFGFLNGVMLKSAG